MDYTTKRSYKKIDIEPYYIGSANATVSGDGLVLATAVLEDVVVVNRETDEVVHQIQGDGDVVTALQLTPDGNELAIVSQSQQLRIFDLQQSKFVKTFKLPAASYISSVDPTSSLFAFGLTDGSVIVWDIEGSFITHNFKGHPSTVSALRFFGRLDSKDWKLASGDIMGTVKVWDLVKRKCLHTMKEHSATVRGVAFNETGDYFITSGRDNVVIMYSTKSWKEVKTVPVSQSVEACGFFEVDGKELVYTAGQYGIMKVWDMDLEKLVATTKVPLETTEELNVMDVLLLDQGLDSVLLVFSDQTIVEVDLELQNGVFPSVRVMAGNHGTIADMRYVGPNFDKLALATNSPALRIVDLSQKPLDVVLCEGHTDLLNALDCTTDGLWVATGAKDNTARLWRYDDVAGFVCQAVFEGHISSVTAVGLPRTPVNEYPRFLITASEDLTIKKWTVPKPADEVVHVKNSDYTRKAHDKMIHSIDISPNNDLLATASHDKNAKIWDLQAGETVGVLKGHKRPVYDITFCAYDRLVVTGSGDQMAKVWSLDDLTCVKTFQGQANAIQRVSFLAKNQFVVGAGADGLIKVWEVSSGTCVQTLDNHDNRIWALCLKNDGNEFVSADADGAITVWQDNTEEVQELEAENRKLRVEQEQSLENYISDKDWVNAFKLALKLNHPMRLYKVLQASIAQGDEGSCIGSRAIEATIPELADDEVVLLFKRVRDWNTNARHFEVAQKLIKAILQNYPVDKLYEIPGLMGLVDGILPYSERNYTRVDDLVEQSFILDYVVQKMDEVV
ncbi:hypothetical protein OGAPHI_001167 [Ogataea philodendri]|uniref:U3 small nucleolar RNA-associated protein 13 C-terminal domain-containing protein n=1 Tax=Ogataea philodendri TaxID=1378263 RepID=A0A9P8PEP9_9ASCO|nr:uncharacterized protein OGAPHI_001167 [Ogataea philodendri]KAH3670652.1 hypothetical protein OGAPHI_001167 [Ogataea philodendri]